MEKFPGEVLRLSPVNFSPPTFQTGRFPGENDVSPVKLPGEEFGLKGVLKAPSSGELLPNLNLPFKWILRRFEVVF